MTASFRSVETFGIADLAAGLCWADSESVLMIWGYYDESGEYDAAGNLINMTVGGCFAPLDAWKKFEVRWKKALNDEELNHFHFHMTDFEAWRHPFDFTLPDGSRDHERHKRLLSTLLDLMIEFADGLYGFSSLVPPVERSQQHKLLLEDCIIGAVSHAIREVWDFYRQPVNLVFARQSHFPESEIKKVIGLYDFGDGEGRIKSQAVANVQDIGALQAADILAYEMARWQRDGRAERYPFAKMREAARAHKLQMTIKWGPIRSRRVDLSDAPQTRPS